MGWHGVEWGGVGWNEVGWDGVGWEGVEYDAVVVRCKMGWFARYEWSHQAVWVLAHLKHTGAN